MILILHAFFIGRLQLLHGTVFVQEEVLEPKELPDLLVPEAIRVLRDLQGRPESVVVPQARLELMGQLVQQVRSESQGLQVRPVPRVRMAIQVLQERQVLPV